MSEGESAERGMEGTEGDGNYHRDTEGTELGIGKGLRWLYRLSRIDSASLFS